MNTDPQTFVITGMALTGVVVVAGNARQNHAPPISQIVGLGIVTVGLSFGAQISPKLATGLTALVLVSAVLSYGQKGLFGAISKTVQPSAARSGSGTIHA